MNLAEEGYVNFDAVNGSHPAENGTGARSMFWKMVANIDHGEYDVEVYPADSEMDTESADQFADILMDPYDEPGQLYMDFSATIHELLFEPRTDGAYINSSLVDEEIVVS